jgi:hypothetical protein
MAVTEQQGWTRAAVRSASATKLVLADMADGRGHGCIVVAPSLTPKTSGDPVKSDRRGLFYAPLRSVLPGLRRERPN